jgi:hypothetical protein
MEMTLNKSLNSMAYIFLNHKSETQQYCWNGIQRKVGMGLIIFLLNWRTIAWQVLLANRTQDMFSDKISKTLLTSKKQGKFTNYATPTLFVINSKRIE